MPVFHMFRSAVAAKPLLVVDCIRLYYPICAGLIMGNPLTNKYKGRQRVLNSAQMLCGMLAPVAMIFMSSNHREAG